MRKPVKPDALPTHSFVRIQSVITFDRERDEWHDVLTVADDALGMAEHIADRTTSLGFVGIRERLASFGGSFTIASQPGQGTRVTIAIPAGRRAPKSENADRRKH